MSSPKVTTAISAKRDAANRMYQLKLEDKSVQRYPYVWLRDNCRCVECYDPKPKWRLGALINTLDPDVEPLCEEITDSGKTFEVQWPEKHSSRFPVEWLARMRFSESTPDPIDPYRYPKRLWGAELQNNVPTFLFDEILENDQTAYDWLQALLLYGLAVIKKAPQESKTIERIGNRVRFLKQTFLGQTAEVNTQPNPKNVTLTNKALRLHVDLPYLEYAPGIELLHCIEQSAEGGDNQFTDAFHCAEQLKQRHPDLFEILTTTAVEFRNWKVPQDRPSNDNDDFHIKYTRPIIELSPKGHPRVINYSDALRSPHIDLPVEKVHGWYTACKAFNRLMYSPDNMIQFKLDGGEIACFDNQRMVHGRSAYKLTEGGRGRHMETGYIDWDQACSRMRVIRERLGEDPGV